MHHLVAHHVKTRSQTLKKTETIWPMSQRVLPLRANNKEATQSGSALRTYLSTIMRSPKHTAWLADSSFTQQQAGQSPRCNIPTTTNQNPPNATTSTQNIPRCLPRQQVRGLQKEDGYTDTYAVELQRTPKEVISGALPT